jgi:hypothetical protein
MNELSSVTMISIISVLNVIPLSSVEPFGEILTGISVICVPLFYHNT